MIEIGTKKRTQKLIKYLAVKKNRSFVVLSRYALTYSSASEVSYPEIGSKIAQAEVTLTVSLCIFHSDSCLDCDRQSAAPKDGDLVHINSKLYN